MTWPCTRTMQIYYKLHYSCLNPVITGSDACFAIFNKLSNSSKSQRSILYFECICQFIFSSCGSLILKHSEDMID